MGAIDDVLREVTALRDQLQRAGISLGELIRYLERRRADPIDNLMREAEGEQPPAWAEARAVLSSAFTRISIITELLATGRSTAG